MAHGNFEIRRAKKAQASLRTSYILPQRSLTTAIILFLICTNGYASDSWWDRAWNFRYEVSVQAVPSGSVAWAQFNIPPGCHPRGIDVRVLDDRGIEAKREVVFFEPALYGVVAFETNASRDYWLYLGNPNPSTRAVAWTAEAGVFMETRQLESGNAMQNANQINQAVERSTHAFGAGFRSKIWDGFNPYGEPDRYLSIYRAWLRVDQPGRYLFATVSDDASILSVDGKQVVVWGGQHRVNGGEGGQHNGAVNLRPGIHRLDYIHCDFQDEQCAVAAWRPPNAPAMQIIFDNDFVPSYAARVGDLEQYNEPLVPNFSAAQQNWVSVGDGLASVYNFLDQTTDKDGRVVEWKWEFGDGTSMDGASVKKMFFQRGDYSVKLTVRDDKGRMATTERPVRVQAIDTEGGADERMLAPLLAGEASAQPLDQLSARDALTACRLLIASGMTGKAAETLRAILDREGGAIEDVSVALAYLDLLGNDMQQPEEAVKQGARFLAAVGDDHDASAQLGLCVGRLLLNDLERPEEALLHFKAALLQAGQIQNRDRAAPLKRELFIAHGDAYRRLAHGAEALADYKEAEAIPLPGAQARPYDVSSYALTVESDLLRKEFDAALAILDRWESEYPTERLAGCSTILRARMEAGVGDIPGAMRELETYLSCDPVGVYAKQALLQLGGLYAAANMADEAERAYRRVLDEFQDDEVRARAQKGLESIGRGR